MPNQNQLVIAIGGTGKSVALVHRKLARLFDDPAEVIVIDMPFGGEAIDNLLDQEGVPQQNFITPWPGGAKALTGVTFDEVIGLNTGGIDRPVGHTLFADDELNSLVEKGMNCRPIVGATIAMRKFWASDQDPQLLALREKISQYNDIFIVGSIAGGTGAGVMPTLARWLTEVCRKQVHGVLFLPWIKIGAGTGSGPSDSVMQANAYAVLKYLEQVDPSTNKTSKNQAPFKDYVVIGAPGNLEADTTATSGNHPLHLVAATYILYFDQLINKNPESSAGPFYLEIPANGMREAELQPIKGFSLEHALYRQFWYRDVLNGLSAQKPDQSWDVMAPPGFANFLAPRVLRESVREIAITFGGHVERGNIWEKMSSEFNEESQKTSERVKQFETITSRDSNHLVYNIDWDRLKQQANSSIRRARREAHKIRVPDFNKQVTMLASAEEASKAISRDVFKKLGDVARSVTKGGRAQEARTGSSTIFLPSGVHNPRGVSDFTRNPLTNFRALVSKYAGGDEAVNMPEPQARRYQFNIVLAQALGEYRLTPSQGAWDSNDALAQFTALLEGVIFGQLQIKLFDLERYGFKSPHERRILGVLVDAAGTVYGGTDIETLFFPAPEAWQGGTGALKKLSDDNVMRRNTNIGRYARALLKKFRDSFPGDNRPLWLEVLDTYFDVYKPPAGVDEGLLKVGWKQVGPVQLHLPNGRYEYRYLPVYEADFFKLATMGLGDSFVPRNDEIHLKAGSTDIGTIYYPRNVGTGLSPKVMGAGCIELLPGARGRSTNTATKINYNGLQQTCESLVNEASGNTADIGANPFSYPDVIRLVFEHDGFLAEHFLQGQGVDGRFGQRFLQAITGSAIPAPPEPAFGQRLPLKVHNGDYYFIDEGGQVYAEKYHNKDVNELSTLGQALWLIFSGQATQIQGKDVFVDAAGNVILEYANDRFAPGEKLGLIQPDQSQKAAELRGLVHQINDNNTDPLFKEALQCWLDYFSMNFVPGKCTRNLFVIGNKKWWRP